MREVTKVMPLIPELERKKRVAAYARVSLDSERLRHSLSAQISYYSEYIQKNPHWIYAGVYADDYAIIGISRENLVKSRVSELVPFSFSVRASTNSYLKVKI